MNIEVYKFLLQTYGRNLGQWVGFFAEIFRVVVMRVYVAIAIAQVTASVASGDFDSAKRYALYFFIAYLLATIVGTCGEILSVHVECKQYAKLSIAFYQKLVGKDISFYRDNQTGYLASIFRQHLDTAIILIRLFRGEILGSYISLIIPPIVLFVASPQVGLVALLIVLTQFIYVMWSSSKATKYRHISHELYRKVTGEVSDVITNVVAFKSSGIENEARSRMADMLKKEADMFEIRRRKTILLDLPRNIITACGITLAIYLIVSKSSGADPQSLGLIVLTLTYMFQIIRSVDVLPAILINHDDLITKIYPTLKYLRDDYERICDPINPKKLLIEKGEIDINSICFSYQSHSNKGKKIPVFNNLTINIKGGEQVGIVGLSGAGKSTLASLLLRFDEIDSGSIKIDGLNIKDVRQNELRQKIAYVPQEPLLFHRSIKENIAYYNTGIDDEEIVRAAKAAHAHNFIKRLPEGYNTVVGERGIKLSGGQKQRVVIARAILKKSPIMIFDEATSALDSESEQIIQRALPEIIGKQTAIVVAHRLSTVAGLDRIIVMHEGKIIESGNHEELLDLNGCYASLWQKQTSEFVI